ncbi:ArsR family transcriptional regulator [Mycobacteroides saopaulense]|uniref:ArsR family transcriptional regulator n=1 Tax=Mycobacteroides saopaulense TaxID=1578165 RepID=A0A1S4VY30_9MYCO|nr:metalloregulator ArsR/SmtB family transcription factor [Mycobacteroides saopaulense]ALR13636.1 ArsR family transcriptional regulator [Mycobacteroides saopaulense]ORB50043.1 ArsR family transcriptional regulator [Mycobacteroides saopaulense]
MPVAPEVKRDFKNRLYGEFSRIGKALSSGPRLEILDVLAQGARTVESLAVETALSVANTSRHLQVLRQVQLVTSQRDGTYVRYQLSGPEVTAVVLALRHTAEQHLAEVDRVVRDYLGDRDSLEPITPDELARRMAHDDVVLLDVRPAQEYAAGHIDGAVSLPVDKLHERLAALPRDKHYIAYCRGPYCVYADEAVDLLQSSGIRAQRLTEGYPEWRLAGRPVSPIRRPA